MSSPVVIRQETSTIKSSQKFEGHTEQVTGVIHLAGEHRMMTCSNDGSLRVWNLKNGKQIGEDWRDGDSGVRTIALSPDGEKVVSGSWDGGVRLWDIDTGKVIARCTGGARHTRSVNSVCWSRDGQRVVIGSFNGTARQWNVESGEVILSPIKTRPKLRVVIYSPDMTMFATGGNDGLYDEHPVRIWDAKTGKPVATLKGHTESVWCLAWTPDGKTLISGSFDSSIRTWNTSNWKQLAVLDGHTIGVHSIAISPNGRILASASWDSTARLWNLDNNQPISSPLHHVSLVNSVSFSSDGKLLATACWDHNAYTWDVTAILKEAGLEDLLDQRDKSVLAADATRRPVRRPIKVSPRVPRGFFNDSPNPAHLSARRRLHPLSSSSNDSTLHSRFISLFRPINPIARDTPPFHWVRNRLSPRQSGADIELHERPSAVVDVPHCQAKRRNASARERRRPIPPRPIRKNPTAGSSRPPNSTATQQSSGAAQAQSSLQPHAAVSTSTIPPVVANTTNPRATIQHAGRWTRFWLFVCCASPEYTDGHH